MNLNKILQSLLNPKDSNKQEVIIAGQLFREGDKVMQTKNNYNIEWESDDDKGTGIFNGDIGILEKINTQNGLVTINFDGRIAELPAEHLADLDLSYAITVHKSQGSEFKAVIIPTMGVVANLAYRNLLYTAVTRAKDMLITVGSGDLIYKMTANDKKAKRYSALSHFLKAEF
jgi:exodeoxyribonuclease V alpha subunit